MFQYLTSYILYMGFETSLSSISMPDIFYDYV